MCLIAVALALAGCQTSAHERGDLALSGPDGPSAGAAAARAEAGPPDGATTAPGERPGHVARLTMRAAMLRAVRYSPALQVVREEIKARRGETFQAGRIPNPEIGAEVENFGGTGDFKGFESADTTISLAQVIELGGKRLKRLRVAELEESLAAWDFEAARLTVASQALQAFVDVLVAQKRLAIHREVAAIMARLTDTVRERVRAGKVSSVELDRARVEQARALVALKQAQTTLSVARRRMALFWGATSPDFERAVGELSATNHLPPPERFRAYLERNPNIARWADEIARRQAALALERAKAIPNLTIGAGVRHFEESDDSALVAQLSIPLQVFDRNRGNIRAASARVAKSLYEREAANIDINTRFIDAYGALRASEAKLRVLVRQVLPSARRVFASMERGYREGKFDLLNVLDAQRTLIQTRLDVIEAQAEFHKARAIIEGLIGRDLYSL